MWIREVVSACLKLTLKTVKGSPIPPSSNALETPPPQNDDPFLVRLTEGRSQVKQYRLGSELKLQIHVRSESYDAATARDHDCQQVKTADDGGQGGFRD